VSTPIRTPDDPRRWPGQSLARGAAGIALLHIERAHLGLDSWQTAHFWVTEVTREEISSADDTGLFFGAPALAHVLHAACADGIPRYRSARADLDAHVTLLTHRRVEAAHARIDRYEPGCFAEYDLLRGLTGLGTHLLAYAPGDDALGRVLTYLVRLTQPLRSDSGTVPGWWVFHDPHLADSPAFPGGHANLGLAHGIAGPLALLAQSLRRGITVDGHRDAMAVICAWLDTWRQDTDAGPWWPQWITRDEVRTGRSNQRGPLRPSWCYGTPGLARAQQLVGIATGDLRRQQLAEHALTEALSDPAQLARIIDTSLCHGWAGLHQAAWRAARDALTPAIGAHLPHLADQLTRAVQSEDIGFLEGDAGIALARGTATRDAPPVSGWDVCLLIN
jgi:hypothetical protein